MILLRRRWFQIAGLCSLPASASESTAKKQERKFEAPTVINRWSSVAGGSPMTRRTHDRVLLGIATIFALTLVAVFAAYIGWLGAWGKGAALQVNAALDDWFPSFDRLVNVSGGFITLAP